MEAFDNVYGINASKKTILQIDSEIQRRERRFGTCPSHWETSNIKNDENIEAVLNFKEEDRRITVTQIAKFLDISYSSANIILHHNFRHSKISAR